MSGVSVTSGGNVDLDALVAGGDSFLARIKALQEQKAQADASLEALKIGKDANAAYSDAQVNQAAALKVLADAKEQAAAIVANAHAEAAALLKTTKDQASGVLDTSQKSAFALDAQVANAKKDFAAWHDSAKAQASGILDSANATKAAAEKQHAENLAAAKALADAQAQTQAHLNAAKAKQDKLDAALNAIKVAAS